MQSDVSQRTRYANLMRYVENWGIHFQVKFGLNRQERLRIRGTNGVEYQVPRQMYHLFKEVVLDDCYFRGLPEISRNGPVFVDIGANIGLFALFAKSRYPDARVLCFEPVPPNFEFLAENIKAVPDPGVEIINQAVSSSEGSVTLHYHLKRPWPTAASMDRSDEDTCTVTVQSTTLEGIMGARSLDRIDLLKLDCEGAEFDIIYETPHSVLQRIDRIALEYHPSDQPGHHRDDLEKHLRSAGFETGHGGVTMLWAWRPSLADVS